MLSLLILYNLVYISIIYRKVIYVMCTVVKVLRYKSEGRWFDPSWCHWSFSLA